MNIISDFFKKRQETKAALQEKHGEDFAEEHYAFRVNKAEYGVIKEWLESLKPEIMEIQRKTGQTDPLGIDGPYYGSTGGGVTYTFTPTSIGDILVVKEATTGKELNVTEALDWFFFG